MKILLYIWNWRIAIHCQCSYFIHMPISQILEIALGIRCMLKVYPKEFLSAELTSIMKVTYPIISLLV